MKFLLSLAFSSLLFTSLFSQSNVIGTILTLEGEEIKLYERANKKAKVSRMIEGCDCQLTTKNGVLYADSEGKLEKISQTKIDQLTLNQGAKYCTEGTSTSTGSTGFAYDLVLTLPAELKMLGLPLKKNGGLRVLQSVFYQSDKYLLMAYQSRDMQQMLAIFTADDHQFVAGRYNSMQVGFQKQGMIALKEIKKYFKDCEAMIKTIDEAVAHNAKEKKMRNKIPVLRNIQSTECQ